MKFGGVLRPADVYNVDDTGLFFKATAVKGIGFNGVTSYGRKSAKDRVTLLIGGSAMRDMLPIMMIGKSTKPRELKGKIDKLPVQYKNFHKAWMTTPLFEE